MRSYILVKHSHAGVLESTILYCRLPGSVANPTPESESLSRIASIHISKASNKLEFPCATTLSLLLDSIKNVFETQSYDQSLSGLNILTFDHFLIDTRDVTLLVLQMIDSSGIAVICVEQVDRCFFQLLVSLICAQTLHHRVGVLLGFFVLQLGLIRAR